VKGTLDSEGPLSHFHVTWLNGQMMFLARMQYLVNRTQAGFQLLLLSGTFSCKVQPVQQYIAALHLLPNSRYRKVSEKIEKEEIFKKEIYLS